MTTSTQSSFHHALGSSRLGRRHDSLEAYTNAVGRGEHSEIDTPKEFSLVTILRRRRDCAPDDRRSRLSILIGKKLRGFGAGFYNCFGGKLETELGEHTHPAQGATREVQEETGISVPLSIMEESFVGTLNFTFEDWQDHKAMRVHLFCVFVSFSEDTSDSTQKQNELIVNIDHSKITGCEEIEPLWVHNIFDLPLHQMFADDSIWLKMLLHHHEASVGMEINKINFDAWFHFHKGGAERNSIMHYYLQKHIQQPVEKYSLEKKLFHALHDNNIHNPSIKEFKESWSFVNNVRTFLKEEERIKYVFDVAGGHGALAALFLLLLSECNSATVIDPAIVKGKIGINDAWSHFWGDKRLTYRHECLRTGLRKELDSILVAKQNETISPANVLVVACHACQHLTDETLEIASEYGVNVAVMPCCQKDHNGTWKHIANRNSLSFGMVMDLLAAGKMMAWSTGLVANVEYLVKMKLIDSSISPHHNRMIICKSVPRRFCDTERELAHQRLASAYLRAHKVMKDDKKGRNQFNGPSLYCLPSLFTGICIGILCCHMMRGK